VAVVSEQAHLLIEFPAPQTEQAGWYPDPLRITDERYWDGTWLEQTRPSPLGLPSAPDGLDDEQERRWNLRWLLRDRQGLVPPLNRAAREERAQEREREDRALAIEAERQAFFHSPAGRARLSYNRGHRLFQYELELDRLEPTVIPGPIGSPARETTDPVDILNSVIVEGWKLVTGKFVHIEVRNSAVGFYLFKRSQKRRQPMNDPWQS
jgi:Protein of unknown function (DUF2510)